MPTNATQLKKLLIAERKSMREKQKNSAFLRKTLSIYNGMKKRAKELGREAEINFTLDLLRELITRRLGGECAGCRTKLTVSNFTVDHDQPIARGGKFERENLAICDKPCNWQKGKLTAYEFSQLLEAIEDFDPVAAADVKRRLTIGGKWSFKS